MNDQSLRVLFIDDDVNLAEVMSKLIKTRCYPATVEAFFATSLEEGIKKSQELIPCIVFLDLLFPDNAGWKHTADQIHRIRGAAIICTQLPEDDMETELYCRKKGAIDVFHKDKVIGLIDVLVRTLTNVRLNALARSAVVSKKMEEQIG